MRYMLVRSGLARSEDSAPRDLWQPDSANQHSYIHWNGRKREVRERERKNEGIERRYQNLSANA